MACRVLRLTIDKKEHEANYDKRLNERGEEEDDAHVVAATLAAGAVLHLFFSLWAVFGDLGVAAAVHGCSKAE